MSTYTWQLVMLRQMAPELFDLLTSLSVNAPTTNNTSCGIEHDPNFVGSGIKKKNKKRPQIVGLRPPMCSQIF